MTLLQDAHPEGRDLAAAQGRCAAVSLQGNQCQLPNGHGQGCHEAMVDGDSRRWWGSAVVGTGPEYEPLRRAAREIVAEWCPNGYQGGYWGALGGGVVPGDDGKHLFTITDRETFRTARNEFDLETLRAGAISLLIYCEAVDAEA